MDEQSAYTESAYPTRRERAPIGSKTNMNRPMSSPLQSELATAHALTSEISMSLSEYEEKIEHTFGVPLESSLKDGEDDAHGTSALVQSVSAHNSDLRAILRRVNRLINQSEI